MQENYFFALSRYSAAVQEHCARAGAILPERARNEVLAWIADGARDFSISRATVDWGIRVPQDPSQTVYVWFDALIGYLSALLEASDVEGSAADAPVERLLTAGWPADVHIIGKDILRFHAVYWPGMLMSMGLPLPRRTFGHGFLTKDGLKMGKSLGNVLDPFRLVQLYGADAVRCAALPCHAWLPCMAAGARARRQREQACMPVHALRQQTHGVLGPHLQLPHGVQVLLHEGDCVWPGRGLPGGPLPRHGQRAPGQRHREPHQPVPGPAEEELRLLIPRLRRSSLCRAPSSRRSRRSRQARRRTL
jgi:tRNA synthetases class I (M)